MSGFKSFLWTSLTMLIFGAVVVGTFMLIAFIFSNRKSDPQRVEVDKLALYTEHVASGRLVGRTHQELRELLREPTMQSASCAGYSEQGWGTHSDHPGQYLVIRWTRGSLSEKAAILNVYGP